MIDRQLLYDVSRKAKTGQLNETDFGRIFTLFGQICNSDEILRFTLKGYTESFQFCFDQYAFGIWFENGNCQTETGMIALADVTFWIHKETALDILNGRIYSAVAHMNGDVDYTGYKDGAIRFIGILESVLDIIHQAEERGEEEQ